MQEVDEFQQKMDTATLTYRDIRRIEISIARLSHIMLMATGSDEYNESVRNVQRMITLLYQVQMAYTAVQMARMAAGDPIAWFFAGVTVVTTAVSLYDSTRGY